MQEKDKLSGWLVASPTYGRDYKTEEEVIAAFVSGKDFLLRGLVSTYFSVRDLQVGTMVELRYNKLAELAVYEVTGNE